VKAKKGRIYDPFYWFVSSWYSPFGCASHIPFCSRQNGPGKMVQTNLFRCAKASPILCPAESLTPAPA